MRNQRAWLIKTTCKQQVNWSPVKSGCFPFQMTHCMDLVTLILAVRGLFCPLPVLNHILVNELSQNQIGRFLLGAGTVSHSPILSSFPCWYVGPRTQKTFIALAAAGWMGRKTQEEWRILENSCCAAKAMIQQNFLGRTKARNFFFNLKKVVFFFFFNLLWFFQFGKSYTISQSFRNLGTFFFFLMSKEGVRWF